MPPTVCTGPRYMTNSILTLVLVFVLIILTLVEIMPNLKEISRLLGELMTVVLHFIDCPNLERP